MSQSNKKNNFYLLDLRASSFYNLFLNACLLVFITGCNKTPNSNNKAIAMDNKDMRISEKTQNALMNIKDKHIYFMHHSVGGNILSGLKNLSSESGVDLNIVVPSNQVALYKKVVVSSNQVASHEKVFIDATGGKNQQPKTKVDSFVEQIKGLNSKVVPDIAFMKFCFVDFNPNTNIDELFSYYRQKIDTLKNERPDIKLAHLTVPLKRRPNTIKDKINRLLGRLVWEDSSNVKRAEFNNLLFETFPQDPIFDIARVESTLPDGTRSSFTHGEKTYYSLASEYTDDGGHLNALGQRRAAIEIAEFLAAIPNTKN